MTAQIIAYAEWLGFELDTWQVRVIDRVIAGRHIGLIGMIRDGKTPKQLGAECTAAPVRLISPCRCRYDVHPLAHEPALSFGEAWPMPIRWFYEIEDSEGDPLAWGVYTFRIHSRCPHHGDTSYMCTCVGPVAMRGLPCPTHHQAVR